MVPISFALILTTCFNLAMSSFSDTSDILTRGSPEAILFNASRASDSPSDNSMLMSSSSLSRPSTIALNSLNWVSIIPTVFSMELTSIFTLNTSHPRHISIFSMNLPCISSRQWVPGISQQFNSPEPYTGHSCSLHAKTFQHFTFFFINTFLNWGKSKLYLNPFLICSFILYRKQYLSKPFTPDAHIPLKGWTITYYLQDVS